ncbi:uncharacterized protein LOC106069130 isoform X3 [Biomphalaria glabrata]|uniref:Uncharacterized protein LOC106069130 isoform X3 n=1 Tax=Biomphalaria glabrata TaxID=6526 RepID=A0A9U8EF76_BIOGL|nr:uncharacterized protein LOC106069130 isoform X3 [Biomphalaria glabrata]
MNQTGIILLVLIAVITDHCCHLIVKCKYQAIRNVKGKTRSGSNVSSKSEDEVDFRHKSQDPEDIKALHQMLVSSTTYGDIGKIAFGSYGLFIVNICILFTQFGFCIAYFIFIGNTIYSLFPKENSTVTSTYHAEPDASLPIEILPSSVPIYNISEFISRSTAPDLRWLVLSPAPLFVGFALIRQMRHLGIVSVCANLSIFLGGIVTLIYISDGFSLSSDWHLYKWTTLPIFFGLVTSSYEGIGTIVPIESSMEGNHHNFAPFLHSAILILSSILSTFGIIGYLRYGEATEQILNKNIPTTSPTGMLINIFLCVGVLLTFPLQIYPVIEISETYLLGKDCKCIARKKGDSSDNIVDGEKDKDDVRAVLIQKKEKINTDLISLPTQIPAWKRNILRIFIVLITAGLAVLLRDFFAYVSSFVGAIGSSVLAYILPCLFHLKLCGNNISCSIKIKDYSIIIFGVLASIVSLYTTIKEVVDKLS